MKISAIQNIDTSWMHEPLPPVKQEIAAKLTRMPVRRWQKLVDEGVLSATPETAQAPRPRPKLYPESEIVVGYMISPFVAMKVHPTILAKMANRLRQIWTEHNAKRMSPLHQRLFLKIVILDDDVAVQVEEAQPRQDDEDGVEVKSTISVDLDLGLDHMVSPASVEVFHVVDFSRAFSRVLLAAGELTKAAA